jgi:hypothetical protein
MPREELPTHEDNGSLVDYLEEDPEVPTQRYCVVSFLSPEKILKQKDTFYTEQFVKWLDYEWKIKGMEQFMNFVSKKYTLKLDDLFKDLEEFTKLHQASIKETDIHEQYQVFLLKEEKHLETQFTEQVNFRTNVRGVKLRRVFANLEEAQMFAKVLQRKYPRDSLYVGKVGCWLPWDPSEHAMPEVEYAEKELNELMRRYKENEVNRDIFFEEEKAKKIQAQKEENEKRRAEARLALEQPPVHPTEGAIREQI